MQDELTATIAAKPALAVPGLLQYFKQDPAYVERLNQSELELLQALKETLDGPATNGSHAEGEESSDTDDTDTDGTDDTVDAKASSSADDDTDDDTDTTDDDTDTADDDTDTTDDAQASDDASVSANALLAIQSGVSSLEHAAQMVEGVKVPKRYADLFPDYRARCDGAWDTLDSAEVSDETDDVVSADSVSVDELLDGDDNTVDEVDAGNRPKLSRELVTT